MCLLSGTIPAAAAYHQPIGVEPLDGTAHKTYLRSAIPDEGRLDFTTGDLLWIGVLGFDFFPEGLEGVLFSRVAAEGAPVDLLAGLLVRVLDLSVVVRVVRGVPCAVRRFIIPVR